MVQETPIFDNFWLYRRGVKRKKFLKNACIWTLFSLLVLESQHYIPKNTYSLFINYMHDLSQIYIFLLQSQRVERNFFEQVFHNRMKSSRAYILARRIHFLGYFRNTLNGVVCKFKLHSSLYYWLHSSISISTNKKHLGQNERKMLSNVRIKSKKYK